MSYICNLLLNKLICRALSSKLKPNTQQNKKKKKIKERKKVQGDQRRKKLSLKDKCQLMTSWILIILVKSLKTYQANG